LTRTSTLLIFIFLVCLVVQGGILVASTDGGEINPIFEHSSDTIGWLRGSTQFPLRLTQHFILHRAAKAWFSDQWNAYLLMAAALHLFNACLTGLVAGLVLLLLGPKPGRRLYMAAVVGGGVAAILMSNYDHGALYDLSTLAYPLQTCAALGTMAAGLLYLRLGGWPLWGLCMLFHLAGVASHSFAFLFPGVLLAVELVHRRHRGLALVTRWIVIRYALLAAMMAPMAGIISFQTDLAHGHTPALSQWPGLFMQHITLHFWQLPAGKSTSWERLPTPGTWGYFLVLAAMAIGGLVMLIRGRVGILTAALIFGFLWHVPDFFPLLVGAGLGGLGRSTHGMAGTYILIGVWAGYLVLALARRAPPAMLRAAPVLWAIPISFMVLNQGRWEAGIGRLIRGDFQAIPTCQSDGCASLRPWAGESDKVLASGRCWDLTEADLTWKKLAGADLRGSRLVMADLEDATLPGVRLEGACMSFARLEYVNMTGARLDGADLSLVRLRRARLRGASLSGALLRGAYIQKSKLSRADLGGANLSMSTLDEVDLDAANLSGVSLKGANLSGVAMRGANLRRVQCSNARFMNMDLRGADLRGADLRNTSFYRSDLSAVDLRDARLENSTFEDVKLQGANLIGVRVDELRWNRTDLTGSLICLHDRARFSDIKGHPLWVPCPED